MYARCARVLVCVCVRACDKERCRPAHLHKVDSLGAQHADDFERLILGKTAALKVAACISAPATPRRFYHLERSQ